MKNFEALSKDMNKNNLPQKPSSPANLSETKEWFANDFGVGSGAED